MPDYARSERIAIRIFDGRMTEAEAIRQTDAEMKLKELTPPECIQRLQSFKQKKLETEAAKRAKHSKRFNYE